MIQATAYKPLYFHQFRDQAAASVLPTTAAFLAGIRGTGGLPSRSAWVLFATPSGALAEVVAHRWGAAPLCRISVNIGMRRQTWSLFQRLGCLGQKRTYKRSPARLGRHYFTRVATPQAEITCLQTELPAFASLAVRLAQNRYDIADLPGFKLLLAEDRQLIDGSTHIYCWSKAAFLQHFQREQHDADK